MEWVHGRLSRLPGYAVFTLAIALLALGGVGTVHAQAGAPQGAPGVITLDVVDADLSQVVRILMAESKQSIVIGDPEAREKKVTAMLNNVSLESALKHVVESVGCSWRREPDGVYVIGKAATLTPAAPAVAQPITGSDTMIGHVGSSRSEARRSDTRVDLIKLYNTSPTEMMWILGIYRIEDAPKHEPELPKTGMLMQQPDGSYKEPTNLSAPPFTESLKANPALAERAPRIANEMPQMPQPNYQGNRQQYRPPAPGQPNQPTGPNQQSSGLLPEGIDYVLTYDLDNSLIVRGDDEGIEELKTIISKLDIAPKQIMIEARFVSIATSELESLGINWSLDRLNTSLATQFPTAGNILVGYANGNLMANLKTQLQKSHGKLVNAPIVSTMNNMPASIGFQTMIPYTTSQSVWNSGGAGSSSYVTFIPVTTQLWVLPRINNADNSVTINLMPQIADVEKFVPTENGDVPIVNTQFIQTQRRVANGETIVLGGLIRKNSTETVDKIPLLADLPIVGPLFRSTKDQVDDKELLIFLTPTIIPEKPIAGSGVGVVP